MAIRSVPQPPFSAELLADLHAGNTPPDLGDRLWPVVRADTDAMSYLDSLDEVTTRVRDLGNDEVIHHRMPGDVAARLELFLEQLELPANTPEGSYAPGPGVGEWAGSVTALDPGRRWRGHRRLLAAAAAVVAVLVGAGVATQTLRGGDSTPPTAQPVDDRDEVTATAALAALGRNDVTGPLGDRPALARCVAAAGLQRAILGSTDMTYQGGLAVLILLAGPHPPQVTALVVGPGCTTGDPQVKKITDIG